MFSSYVQKEHSHVKHVDILWDEYFENSLKSYTREKRGIGPNYWRQVDKASPIPKGWQNFLQLNNKTELFKLLNEEVMKTASREQVFIVTNGVDVHCVPVHDKTNIAPCNHEEAD